MRLSVELVPRDAAAIETQVQQVGALSRVGLLNVPDLTRFPYRAHDAAMDIRRMEACRWDVVPHVRAMDVEPHRPWLPAAGLVEAGIKEVVVVTGDPPDDMRHPVTGANAVQVIRKLKHEHPDWKVYAALDPYRSNFVQERDYALRKLDAGADGFFSQPFFDLRLLQMWRELMVGVPVFWGITSVTSEASQRYWTTRNRAVFPAGFEPTLLWHQRFAADALRFAEDHDVDLYFMPIRVNIGAWLGEVLG